MGRKLHIGGTVRTEGWEVLNAVPSDCVDHIGNANDLSRFGDGTFDAIYASHVVEHLDYKDELLATLREWRRVMVPGGKLYVGVPDLDVLCRLFIERNQLTGNERFFIMRMMFGGHVDKYDYHVVGFNDEILGAFLQEAGFVNLRRVDNFGLFSDTSAMQFRGVPISLNVIAHKPGPGGEGRDIGADQACPCGSGQSFGACHGR